MVVNTQCHGLLAVFDLTADNANYWPRDPEFSFSPCQGLEWKVCKQSGCFVCILSILCSTGKGKKKAPPWIFYSYPPLDLHICSKDNLFIVFQLQSDLLVCFVYLH